MAFRGCLECLLKLLNFILTITGLSMIGYGIYLLVEWIKISGGGSDNLGWPAANSNSEILQLDRPMFIAVSLSDSILDKLPKAWFIYLFIGIGAIIVIISFFGCIGAATRSGCCLSCYAILVTVLILIELGAAAFIFFDHSWKELIPADKTGNFDEIYDFLKENWKIAKWVSLGAVILEVLVFLLAVAVRAANQPDEFDSDDEYINPRSNMHQPLINNNKSGVPATGVPATGVPVTGTLDHRPSRNDAWSQRMRDKYGLDTSEFMDPSRQQTAAAAPAEEKGGCTIL